MVILCFFVDEGFFLTFFFKENRRRFGGDGMRLDQQGFALKYLCVSNKQPGKGPENSGSALKRDISYSNHEFFRGKLAVRFQGLQLSFWR